jgi:hypothetical protein
MRRMMVLGVLTLGLITGLASPTAARADRAAERSAGELSRHATPSAEHGRRARTATAHTADASPLFSCEEAPEGLCGRVDVPLDRSDPAAGTVGIFFHFYSHTDAGRPPLDPIFASSGGPGVSITQEASLWLWVFGPLRERHDLVLIDQRGVGRSDVIDCEPLQHNDTEAPPYAATGACAAQLGSAASLYGSADVARDLDAVRAALGVRHLIFYGHS